METKTLYKTINQERARAIAAARTVETGVTHTYYHVGDGWKIYPSSKAIRENAELVEAVRPHIVKFPYDTTFQKLADVTGYEIGKVIAACIWLAKHERYTIQVGRTGYGIAIHQMK